MKEKAEIINFVTSILISWYITELLFNNFYMIHQICDNNFNVPTSFMRK